MLKSISKSEAQPARRATLPTGSSLEAPSNKGGEGRLSHLREMKAVAQ